MWSKIIFYSQYEMMRKCLEREFWALCCLNVAEQRIKPRFKGQESDWLEKG